MSNQSRNSSATHSSMTTVDDEIQALRKQHAPSEGDGKWVVREDGSKVLKVKKRKRRSRQKKHEVAAENRRNTILLFGTLGALTLGIGGYAVGAWLYFNGDGFSDKVERTLAASAGAEVEMDKVKVGVSQASVSTVNLRWSDTNLLKYVELNDVGVSYRLFGFFGGSWIGESIEAKSGEMQVDVFAPWSASQGDDQPLDYDFHGYGSAEMTCYFSDSKESGPYLADSSIEYRGERSGKIVVSGGTLHLPNRSEIEVERALIDILPEGLELTGSFKLQHSEGQEFKLEGELNQEKKSVDLKLTFDEAGLRDWVEFDLGKFEKPVFACTDGKVSYQNGALKVKLPLASNGFVFPRCNMFVDLARVTGLYSNGVPYFTKATLEASAESNVLFLDQLDLQIPGSYVVNGKVTIAKGQSLSGELKVGISHRFKERLEEAGMLDQMGAQEGGYYWFDVTLGGDVNAMSTNFRDVFSSVDFGKLEVSRPLPVAPNSGEAKEAGDSPPFPKPFGKSPADSQNAAVEPKDDKEGSSTDSVEKKQEDKEQSDFEKQFQKLTE